MMKFWDKQAMSPYTSRSVGASRGSRDLTGNGPRNTSNDPLKPATLDSVKIEVPWISDTQKANSENTGSTIGVLKFAHSLEISPTFITSFNGVIKPTTPPVLPSSKATAELSNASTVSPTESRKIPSATLSRKSMGLLEPLQPIKLVIEIPDETNQDCVEENDNINEDNTDEEEIDILDRSDVVSDFSEIV